MNLEILYKKNSSLEDGQYKILLHHFSSFYLFNFVDNSNNLVFKANQDKVFVFGAVDGAEPTAVAGGLMYSGSDAWYLGYENDPQ